jgi:hypothetical protein
MITEQVDCGRPANSFIVSVGCRSEIELNRRHPPRARQTLLEHDTTSGAEPSRSPPVTHVGLTEPCDADGGADDLVHFAC